jgi:hypothetical protein
MIAAVVAMRNSKASSFSVMKGSALAATRASLPSAYSGCSEHTHACASSREAKVLRKRLGHDAHVGVIAGVIGLFEHLGEEVDCGDVRGALGGEHRDAAGTAADVEHRIGGLDAYLVQVGRRVLQLAHDELVVVVGDAVPVHAIGGAALRSALVVGLLYGLRELLQIRSSFIREEVYSKHRINCDRVVLRVGRRTARLRHLAVSTNGLPRCKG